MSRTIRRMATIAAAAAALSTAATTACTPPSASPTAGTSTTTTTPTSTTLPGIADAALRRTTPISATVLGDTTYRFAYTVQNTGGAACVPELVVVLHRTSPSWTVADRSERDVCLAAGASHTVTQDVDLGAGAHWYYSAQWKDSAGYHFFQDPAPDERQLDTPAPPATSGVDDRISSGSWNVRGTLGGAVTGSLGAGQSVHIDCQMVGPAVTVAGFGTSTIYDHITQPVAGWVSDLAMSTTPYAVRDGRLPSCDGSGTTPPPVVTSAAQAAANWAIAEKNSPKPAWSDQLGRPWSGMCEAFVEIAYGTRGRYASAIAHYNARLARGQIHTDANPPVGAFVFYGGGQGYGHVGISIGGGQVISTQGFAGQSLPVWQHSVTGLSNPYYGWATFDGGW